MFGPDGRLYVLNINGTLNVFSIQRNGVDDYVVTGSEELLDVKNIPNHNDDGSAYSGNNREATGVTVVGTAANPVVYVTSSDSRVGGPSGDKDLDTNSGVITRLTWNGSSWDVVDIVRGLPRSEENHATNGLEFVTKDGVDYLIVCSGGHTNAGSPSDNFAWTTEYALSAAILAVNLTQIEALPILTDATSNRQYIYDLPTLDDPTRPNQNGIIDPDQAGYDGVDVNDPWGGNDGLNQAMIVDGGPVQIFSGGYRNTYDLVVTEDGKVYCTDNGANGGWGGLPVNEGMDGTVTNDYIASEPGSSSPVGGEEVNNKDHLTLITDDIQNYAFGSFYGGHPTPVRANPVGAGLFTNPTANANTNSVFRTLIYDPDGSRGAGYTTDPSIALPANWPPVPPSFADIREGDWRGPDVSNPDGDDDVLITVWGTNTNGIDEYTASNFGGAMKGDLLAGKNGGVIRRVELDANGGLEKLTSSFVSNLGGNPLGITCNGDSDPFPGTVWIATFNSTIKILEPQDLVVCILPGQSGYSATGDNDSDGYTNQDEIDNMLDGQTVEDVICNGGSQPNDFDKSAGGNLVSDLNDPDDDNDNVPDASDPFQLGDPTAGGNDAFDLPVRNDLFSDNQQLKGYLGLGFTGMMNNGTANPNWLDWIDRRDDPNEPNPNDILGGAVGAMTMQMTAGTALGATNSQEKAFQYGVNVDQSSGTFAVEGRLFNFTDPLQLYGSSAPANGEIGLFIGDGTQSNYIKLVLTAGGSLQGLQEINDIPQTPLTANVTASQDIVLSFQVNASDGTVTLKYAVDGGSLQTLGTLTAQGANLTAIQNSGTPLAVGLIGTSNATGEEVEGTWDYLYVQGTQPFVEQTLPNVEELVNALDHTVDLNNYFGDDGGDGNLVYTVENNTNAAIGVSINASTLTVSFPSTAEVAEVTVRATDSDNLFAEQTFTVTVSDEPVPILRINANGPTITATDSQNPDWLGGIGAGAQSGSFNGLTYSVNTGTLSTQNTSGRHASLPAYVPQSLFTNERYDVAAAPAMEWTFGLPNGNYYVRLYMGNGFNGTSEAGERLFDISIEGQLVQDDLDLVAAFGHQNGGMLEYPVSLTDGALNVLFEHVVENPLINGIEILSVGGSLPPPITITAIPNQSHAEGDLINLPVLASGGNPTENFSFTATGLPPGIQIEPTTGLIFGTIAMGASSGSVYTSTITVTKPGSAAVNETVDWTVTGPVVAATWNDQTDDENYTARHECSFVQAGDKFYLFGGRENATTLDVYDYQSKSWSQISNSAPAEFNHFQALEYQGLIWVIGAFKDNGFPNETPADFVWAYNPATDEWIQGPEIPTGRKRGSTGLVVYNGKFYIIGGNTIGHNGGYVSWFDEFDPATGVWTALADSPRPRDHFHAAVIGDKLYLAGGRLSGGTGGTFAPLIAEVDVYDFTTATWSSAPDLPTPRAAASVAPFEGELYVIGGEIAADLQGATVNDAVKTTEAFDPAAGSWSTKADLLTERHGTQAIVSGSGIHVTAGSSSLGGSGKMKNMEFFGSDNPVGSPATISQLQLPAGTSVPANGSIDVTVTAAGGNTGVIITDVAITGTNAASFSLGSPVEFALLAPGGSLDLTVGFNGTVGETATLEISYGSGSTASVQLTTAAQVVAYRVNAGGTLTPSHDTAPTDWSADQATSAANGNATTGTPSPYYNVTPPAEDITFGATFSGTNTTGYPDALFSTERYSTEANPNNMQWDFPVDNGDYTVNLLFAETWTGATTIGTRVFDVVIEGAVVLDDFDQTGTFGWNTAGVASIPVTVADGNLDIDFLKDKQNPSIKAIEIISGGGTIPSNDPPVVINPGSQFGVEGDNVSVQIAATDTEACSGLTYSATGLPPGVSIDSNTGLISGTLTEGTGAANVPAGTWIENGGLVVIETESIGTLPGSWKNAATYSATASPDLNNPTDATGDDFIIWQGGQSLGNPGNGLLTYPVQITTPGVYRFQWRSQVANGTNATEHNDTWVKIESDAFYGLKGSGTVCPKGLNPAENDCTGGAPEGAGAGGWFKVYSSGATNWKWSTQTSDNDAHQIYARFDAPGVYNILLSARSSSHAIDRMVLSHSGYSGNPQNLSLAESTRSQGSTVGAAAGSPYDVSITVSDGCIPPASATVDFIWNVTDEQSTASMTLTASSQGRTDHGGVHTIEIYALTDLTTPVYTYSPSASATGEMTVSGITPGDYKVLLRRAGYLQRVQQVTLTVGNTSTTFPELRAGNLNDDNSVSILDFSLLANDFGQSGQPTDINDDGVTNILDFSLQASNFGQSGDTLTNAD
jgi:N-acetylneuraminic acid mutarotase